MQEKKRIFHFQEDCPHYLTRGYAEEDNNHAYSVGAIEQECTVDAVVTAHLGPVQPQLQNQATGRQDFVL